MSSNVFQFQWWASHFNITYEKWLHVTEVLMLTITISWEIVQNSVVLVFHTQPAKRWLSTLNYVILTKTVSLYLFFMSVSLELKKLWVNASGEWCTSVARGRAWPQAWQFLHSHRGTTRSCPRALLRQTALLTVRMPPRYRQADTYFTEH